jgi:Ser/Thr protein kinase RdoA (MazF antagonist)
VALGVKIAEGRQAVVYAWDAGEDAVVKLYRTGFGGYGSEAAALARLRGTGVAPQLVDTVRVDGRDGLVLQRLDGVDMLALLQRRPWRLVGLARMLAQAALRIHRIPAPPGLPDLIEVLGERISSADLDVRLRDFALRLLESLPAGDRLCHGDFHPGNAVVTADGASIIDWPAATRGIPAADFAFTLLLLRQADPLPGTPLLSRMLLSAGRSAFASAFARAYRRGTDQPLLHLDQWMVVRAAARLAEGIIAERRRLLGLVDNAYRTAGPGGGQVPRP